MNLAIDDLKNIADSIVKLLGKDCEIVLHDFTGDTEHTVIHIVNGEISGRRLGDCPSNLLLEQLASYTPDKGKNIEYYTTSDDGRMIRSLNTMITDDKGELTGAFCINMDITRLMTARDVLSTVVGAGTDEAPMLPSEKFTRNVQELMSYYLSEVERTVGKTGADMNKQEKLQALRYLDEHGAFQIARAHVRLCEFFKVSKYTLYTYLDEARKAGAQESL